MIRSLHILHTEALKGPGGQTLRVLNEAQGMMARGHKVTLICRPNTFIYQDALRRGIPCVAMALDRKSFRTARKLRRWLRENPVDVINTHSSADSWVVAMAQLSFRKRKIPVVRTRHTQRSVGRNLKSRWLYTRASQFIVTTGEGVRCRLIEDNGFDPDRIRSFPSGVDHQLFCPGDSEVARRNLGLPVDKTIVGMVALFSPEKGYEDLIRAAGRLENQNLHWVLVGDENRDGSYREKLKQLAREEGVDEQVTFAGFQSDVAPWFQSMDIFCLPTFAKEGVPQVILQAMLCRLPVITTGVGSILDAVEDKVTGLVVQPRDPVALADAIETLTKDIRLREALAEHGHRKGLSHFTLESMLDGMEGVFQKVVESF
nr:glycosyltransferase family 4 protein [Motiliproteus sp. SC1-56]